MKALTQTILNSVVDESPFGIVVVDVIDPTQPVTYANRAYGEMTGYSTEELVGRPFRISQIKSEADSNELRQAFERHEPTDIVVRDIRIDGTAFWSDMSVRPLKGDDGRVTHVVVFCRDVGERIEMRQQLASHKEHLHKVQLDIEHLARNDKLTGVHTRRYFEDMLRRYWAVAQREGRQVSVMVLDIDFLKQYNATFGDKAGDSCLRLVAKAIEGALRRASDLVARYSGGQFAAMVTGMEATDVRRLAELIGARVHELCIHNPKSRVDRFVTVTTGLVTTVPGRDVSHESILEAAEQALAEAKKAGRNTVVSVEH